MKLRTRKLRILSVFNKTDLRILKSPCIEVEKITPDIKRLIMDMEFTIFKGKGVGLAAPQVGINKRIFVITYYKALMTVINPVILHYDDYLKTESEGCLSVPGVNILISRSESIRVTYTNLEGKTYNNVVISGFLARIFQHEYNHLEGKLIVDISSEDGYSL